MAQWLLLSQADTHRTPVDTAANLLPATPPLAGDTSAPVIVVGAGPVGVRAVQELIRRNPRQHIILYGDEATEPYNRVRLSSFLFGNVDWDALTRDLHLPPHPFLEKRFGCAVTAIDRERRCVSDAEGRRQRYSALILATGSRAHVPDIPGVHLNGVYTFRDLQDVQALLARRVRSRRTIILGGGLLGLEAARAMQRFHTRVCIVEHYSRLMMRQLDDGAAAYLQRTVEALGIEIILGDSVKRVLGDARVNGLQLRSDRELECDTVIVATGIVPNAEIARAAGMHVNRGIRVDDNMCSSDPNIYAVGECAEHRGRVYGLVAPGLEHAAVAAHAIQGGRSRYAGSTITTRLKILDLPVFSMGPVGQEEMPDLARSETYRTESVYRKLVIWRGRLIGAIVIGDCPELSRLQEAIIHRRNVWPWQKWRFRDTGLLWPEEELGNVQAWPASATVCNCTGVTCGSLRAAMAQGCNTVELLAARTGASTVCGSCRPLLAELAGKPVATAPARGWKTLLGSSGTAAIAALLFATLLLLPYASSVQVAWQWDPLWRESLWKQVSGFSVLGLSVLLLIMSLRKRIRRFTIGDFPLWRVMHVMLGTLTLAGLAVHTGGRLGDNLNFLLMSLFLGTVLIGAAAGGLVALEHRIGNRAAGLRRSWTWAHILFTWPIPVLLVFHVLKSYYF